MRIQIIPALQEIFFTRFYMAYSGNSFNTKRSGKGGTVKAGVKNERTWTRLFFLGLQQLR